MTRGYINGKHTGTDIRARKGQPIYAVDEGNVITTGYDKRSGNYIIIRHPDGSDTSYSHTGPLDGIVPGKSVKGGQQIGMSNRSGYYKNGNPINPHLHFVYYPNGRSAGGRASPFVQGGPFGHLIKDQDYMCKNNSPGYPC